MNDELNKKKEALFSEIEYEMNTPGIIDFKQSLTKVDAQLHTDEIGIKKNNNSVIGKLIIVLGVIFLLAFLLYKNYNKTELVNSNQQIAMNDEPYKMILNSRSDQQSTIIEQSAITNYLNYNYAEAHRQFDQLSNEFPDEIIYTFYAANSAYAKQDYDIAIADFKRVIENNNPLLIEQSRWYLALSYYKNKDYAKAKNQLKTIQPGQFKYNDSQELFKLIPD